MPENEYILEARGLHKSFGPASARVHALRGLDLRVRRGEFLCVMGPSGCGKSTLLHILGLMTPPDAGSVVIDGEEATGRQVGDGPDDVIVVPESRKARIRREKIGFVFQRFNLLSVLSGYDNIALSLRIRGLRADGRIDELLAAMGVAEVAGRKPAKLSMGEQQRLAVARAVAHSPELLLADEPTGSLDSENKAALLELIRRANRQYAQTIVMITHSASAAAAADRIVYMKDGKIIDGEH